MRYIILLFALTLSIAKASAQDVLNEVLRTSDAILNDTTKSMDERRKIGRASCRERVSFAG